MEVFNVGIKWYSIFYANIWNFVLFLSVKRFQFLIPMFFNSLELRLKKKKQFWTIEFHIFRTNESTFIKLLNMWTILYIWYVLITNIFITFLSAQNIEEKYWFYFQLGNFLKWSEMSSKWIPSMFKIISSKFQRIFSKFGFFLIKFHLWTKFLFSIEYWKKEQVIAHIVMMDKCSISEKFGLLFTESILLDTIFFFSY